MAILCIDRVTKVTEENQNLRKVVTSVSTTLDRVLDLDDDINVRCFLDSYLTKHGFQGRGRKEFIENHFRKDPVCKVMYERLFQRSRPNIHTAAHERPWALVASSLLRSSPGQAVPTTKRKLNQAEWIEVERMWKELCGKWDMEVHPPLVIGLIFRRRWRCRWGWSSAPKKTGNSISLAGTWMKTRSCGPMQAALCGVWKMLGRVLVEVLPAEPNQFYQNLQRIILYLKPGIGSYHPIAMHRIIPRVG